MTVLWTSTKMQSDLESENELLLKTPTLKRPKDTPPSLSSIDINDMPLISRFGQQAHLIADGVEMINALSKIAEVAVDGNDCGLRFVQLWFDKELLHVIGGSPTVAYDIKVKPEEIRISSETEIFEFGINLDIDEISDALKFLKGEFNVFQYELGVRKSANNITMLDKSLHLFRSRDRDNSALNTDDDATVEKVALMRFFHKNTEELPFRSIMLTDEEIDAFPVVYTSDIPVQVRSIMDTKSDYVELAQSGGIMTMRTKDKEQDLTLERFLGCKVVSKNDLPPNGAAFAYVSGKDLGRVFQFKQKEPLNFKVWFYEENGVLESNCLKLGNKNLSVFMGQSQRIELPDKKAYLFKQKGKFEQGTMAQSLEMGLSRNGYPKQEREEIMGESSNPVDIPQEESLDEAAEEVESAEVLQESSLDVAFSALEQARKRVMDDSIILDPNEKVEAALLIEKINNLTERTTELNNKYNSILDLLNHLTSKIEKASAIINILHDTVSDKLISIGMGTTEESARMESQAERNRRLKVEEAVRNAIGCEPTKEGLDMTMFPARNIGRVSGFQQVDNYVSRYGGCVLNLSMILAECPEVEHNLLAKRLSTYKVANIAVRVKKSHYYFPEDVKERIDKFRENQSKPPKFPPIEVPVEIMESAEHEQNNSTENLLGKVCNTRRIKPSPSRARKAQAQLDRQQT